MPVLFFQTTQSEIKRGTLMSVSLCAILIFGSVQALFSQNYFEDFLNPGEPYAAEGDYWYYANDIYPQQNTWEDFIPGDGFCYIKVDPDTTNDTDPSYPFQVLAFGLAYPGRRMEVKMKGALVPGRLSGFIFNYNGNEMFTNEIDIEMAADMIWVEPDGHDIYPPDGWNEVNLNTWKNANKITGEPSTHTHMKIEDVFGNPVSHIDDAFHTYTIDWREESINYYIDDVLQDRHTTNIATGPTEIMVGFRDVDWAGEFNWSGVKTCVVDWLRIEPLGPEPSAKFVAGQTLIGEGESVQFFDQSPTATAWNWSFPGGTPATSSEKKPVVTYPAAGTYDVTLTVSNSSGSKTDTKSAYILVSAVSSFSITQANNEQQPELYPNPSNGFIRLKLPSKPHRYQSVEIFDILGRKVFQRQITRNNFIELNTQKLSAGVYVLRVNAASGVWTKRITIFNE